MKIWSKLFLKQHIIFSFMIAALYGWAQNDLFTTVSAPVENDNSPFKTVSVPITPAAQSAAPEKTTGISAVALPAPARPAAKDPTKPAPVSKWEQELLRDPFWPVGFFPEGWQKKTASLSSGEIDGSGWKSASGKLRISGTSQLGGRTVAIIDGELKSEGDTVEVVHEGQTYQWQIVGIEANGQVQLKKMGIK